MKRNKVLLVCLLAAAALPGCQPSAGPTGSSQPTVDRDQSSPDAAPNIPPFDSADKTGDPATAASNQPAVAEDRITTPQQLVEAMKKRNPGFQEHNLAMQPIDADLLQVAINDAAVTDISPLRKQRIAALDLRFCDVIDLSPVAGMPIVELYLEENSRLSDISPLRGMPLQKVYLSNTAVENLGPLRGAPLVELNAVGAKIKDLSPLSGAPLQLLWLTGCPVSDISPLKATPLTSLTLENTPVADISPLAGHRLQRLHIGGTQVTDLTPIGQMQLSRLIFTPSRIVKGLDVVRNAESIGELGTTFENRMPPAQFWQMYDQGKLEP